MRDHSPTQPPRPCNRCGIPAANGTFSSTVPPGGCITSYDDTDDRWAVYVAIGKAVPFVSGIYEPVDSTTNSGTARSGLTGRRLKQAGGGSGAVWARFTQDTVSSLVLVVGLHACRLSLQAGMRLHSICWHVACARLCSTESACDARAPAFSTAASFPACVVQNLFWQGIDGLPSTTAQTAEECANACDANPQCKP